MPQPTHVRCFATDDEGSSTTSTASVVGHLRTAKANVHTSPSGEGAHSSAVECLLCKEDALGSNPSGSISPDRNETESLKWVAAKRSGPEDRCTTP